MVDGIEEKQNERCASRDGGDDQVNETKFASTSEIVAYHKVKRKFLSLTDMEKEDPDKLQICEFRGQDFELIED